ncbi:hypothetical protein EYZ11_012619 [Aspergillus tanneri]|uniref:Uncharacterized protein n=1 Tax=Aspergillus tanneri TaxID=1220188 RepID=A0A4S3IZR3_9EURO|nr:hypothetical protein EYZ11_012619 [Aspergillus tanneri]
MSGDQPATRTVGQGSGIPPYLEL